MPLKKVKGGWRCPKTGKTYKTKAAARRARKKMKPGYGTKYE